MAVAASEGPPVDLPLLLHLNDPRTLLQECERAELQPDTAPPNLTPIKMYQVHLLALLLNRELTAARALWRRIPQQFKVDPELHALWKVGKAVFKHDTPLALTTLKDNNWSEQIIAPLCSALRRSLIEFELQNIGRAYSRITLDKMASRIGDSAENVSALASSRGWNVSCDGIVSPVPPMEPTTLAPENDQLQKLTDFAAQLSAI